jgi:hypothetical protein
MNACWRILYQAQNKEMTQINELNYGVMFIWVEYDQLGGILKLLRTVEESLGISTWFGAQLFL